MVFSDIPRFKPFILHIGDEPYLKVSPFTAKDAQGNQVRFERDTPVSTLVSPAMYESIRANHEHWSDDAY